MIKKNQSIDYVGNNRYVFNIKGNHYRLACIIIFASKSVYKVYMRFILFSIIIFQISQIGKAQNLSKFDFFLGYGFYEGYNIGSEYYFKSGKQSVSLSIGYDKFKKQESVALALGYNLAIFRSCKNDSNEFKWHLNNKVVVWQLNDEYYLWRAISLIPSINRRFIVYRNISMSLDVGPSFNIVIYNKRKTFEQVGWPYHVMPNFRILFIF